MPCPYQQQQQHHSYSYAAVPVTPAFSSHSFQQQTFSHHSYQQPQQQQCSVAAASSYPSQVEQAVINSQQPIQSNEREQITAGGYTGIYLNKSEADQYRGQVPIEQIPISNDPNPEVIRKKLGNLRYTQEVAVKWLNPPAGPKPGDLVIHERQSQIPPAPPVVLRQEACRGPTPPPCIYRERPPQPPPCIPEQHIEVEAAPVPPPPRRVVVEKLSNLPAKPQNIVIEKWLPYQQQKRRVVFHRACGQQQQCPKNLIVEWEAPEADVDQVCRSLGVENTCPDDYARRYGCELRDPCQMPNLCQCPQQPTCSNQLPELEGDVCALRLVNLEAHGLGEYRRYVQ